MRKAMTYGVLPSQEAFEAAFDEVRGPKGHQRFYPTFAFTNDPRVGTCTLTGSELWKELVSAWVEWDEGQDVTEAKAAGQWCSDVLGVLGFEWV